MVFNISIVLGSSYLLHFLIGSLNLNCYWFFISEVALVLSVWLVDCAVHIPHIAVTIPQMNDIGNEDAEVKSIHRTGNPHFVFCVCRS